MNARTGYALLVVGVVLFAGGLVAPSTTTHTSTTCYDDPWSYGQDCVRSTYETPNTSKGGLIGFGAFLAVIGGVVALKGSSSTGRDRRRSSSQPPESGTTHSLAEQIQKRQSGTDRESGWGTDGDDRADWDGDDR